MPQYLLAYIRTVRVGIVSFAQEQFAIESHQHMTGYSFQNRIKFLLNKRFKTPFRRDGFWSDPLVRISNYRVQFDDDQFCVHIVRPLYQNFHSCQASNIQTLDSYYAHHHVRPLVISNSKGLSMSQFRNHIFWLAFFPWRENRRQFLGGFPHSGFTFLRICFRFHIRDPYQRPRGTN